MRPHCRSVLGLWLVFWMGFAAGAQGPSSSAPPYLRALEPHVEFTSLLTAGDSAPLRGHPADTYRLAGTPDGLGAFDNGDGTLTLLVNHELAPNASRVRAHGAKGAFISKWTLRKTDLQVLDGEDLIRHAQLWSAEKQRFESPSAPVFSRFCSADLAPLTAFSNTKTHKGYGAGRLFLNGEEDRGTARAFAHIASGPDQGLTFELPELGKFARENSLASPFEQDRTIVVGTEDEKGAENQVYVYLGAKRAKGNPVERAGLRGGHLFGVKVIGGPQIESSASGFGERLRRFELVLLRGAERMTGSELNQRSNAAGVSQFLRPEDGAWDTVDKRRFYFATTASFGENSRLWRLTFDDIAKPERGGLIEELLDSQRGPRMLDNLAVDDAGNLYLQEDPGDEPHLARIWRYEPKTDRLTALAEHDPTWFAKSGEKFLTQNEESSGIIDVTGLFSGVSGYATDRVRYFILSQQSHYSHQDPEIDSGGQLILMRVGAP